MADKKQRLGIELSLTLEEGKFKDLLAQIESAFSKVDIKGFEQKLTGVEAKISKVAKEMAALKHVNAIDMKATLDTSDVNEKIVKAEDHIKNFGKVAKDVTGEIFAPAIVARNADKSSERIKKFYSDLENYSAKAKKNALDLSVILSKKVPNNVYERTDYPDSRTRSDHGRVDPKVLLGLKGANGEDSIFRDKAISSGGTPDSGKYSKAEWEAFKENIRKNGIKDAIWVRKKAGEANYEIEEGNHRIIAAMQLGMKSVPLRVDTYAPTTKTRDASGLPVYTKHPDDKVSPLFSASSSTSTVEQTVNMRKQLDALISSLSDPKLTPTKLAEINAELKTLQKRFSDLKVGDGVSNNLASLRSKEDAIAAAARKKELSTLGDTFATEISREKAKAKARNDALRTMGDEWVTEINRAKAKANAATKSRESELSALGDQFKLEISNARKAQADRIRALRNMGDDWKAEINAAKTKANAAVKSRQSELSTLGDQFKLEIDNARKAQATRIRELRAMGSEWRAEIAAERRKADKSTKSAETLLQADWNKQAGTSGVKYKAAGGGYVKNSVEVVDPSNLDAMRRVTAEAYKMNEAFDHARKGTHNFAIKFKEMAKTMAEFYLIRGTFFAISNQINSAISDLLKFNQALADTAAISNASAENVNKFGLAAMMIARNSKMNLEDVMKLMNLLAQSGVNATDVPLVSRVTAMFATGTGSSAENAVRVMTTALNVWNIEASKSAIVADTLTAGLNSAKLEVNELSTVFNYLAPMARQAGFSIQQTTAIIATMSQMGVKASTIGTGTGQLLTRLMAPTKGVKDLAKAYNLELDQLNPRLHKFSEIIRTLQTADGGKAIPVQDLLRGFGQIAGRSVSAAVSADADFFEEMEKNVSLGNASLVAYSKTLEGVGAKLNVLRQTFVQLFGSITSFNGVLGLAYDLALSLTRGLSTVEGKFLAAGAALTGIVAAIYSFRTAIIAFSAANPLTIWLVGLGVLLSGLIAYFGRVSSEVQALGREHDKLAKDMGATQRAFQSLTSIYGEATKAGNLNKNITREHKEEIEKLVRTTPSLHGVIDTSVTKYGELARSIKNVNNQMESLSDNNLNAYNKLVDQLEKSKSHRGWGGFTMSYNDKLAQIDSVERASIANASGNKDKIAAAKSAAEEARATLEVDFKADPTVRKIVDMLLIKQSSISYGNPIDPLKNDPEALNVSKYVKAKPELKGGPDTNPYPTPGIGEKPTSGDTITGIDMADAARKFANDNSKLLSQLMLSGTENDLKAAIEDIKGEKDPEVYAEKKKAIEGYIKTLETQTLKAFTEDQITKMAGAVGAEYDPSKKKPFQFPNTDVGNLNYKNYTQYVKDNPTAFMDSISKVTAEKGFTTASGMNLTEIKIPGFSPEAGNKLTSAGVEKQLDKELSVLKQTADLKKEEARTANEVRNIDIDVLTMEIEINAKKKEAFEKDIATLNTRSLSRDLTADELQQYELMVEKLYTIEDLVESIKRKKAESEDTGFFSNFGKGSYSALKAQGDVKSNTQQLGADITNTTLTGMNTLLDESITKLAKLEWSWKSFATTLGSVMQDIVKELQKYLVKLFVVWSVEQLVGIFSSGGSGKGAQMSSSTSAGNFTLGANGLSAAKFAEGGQVPLNAGVANTDSVAAWLTPGEVVINKPAVDMYGADYFLKHNAKKFAEGGLVGGVSRSVAGADSGVINLQVVNIVDPKDLPTTSDTQIINVINMDIAKRGATYKSVKLATQQ